MSEEDSEMDGQAGLWEDHSAACAASFKAWPYLKIAKQMLHMPHLDSIVLVCGELTDLLLHPKKMSFLYELTMHAWL